MGSDLYILHYSKPPYNLGCLYTVQHQDLNRRDHHLQSGDMLGGGFVLGEYCAWKGNVAIKCFEKHFYCLHFRHHE